MKNDFLNIKLTMWFVGRKFNSMEQILSYNYYVLGTNGRSIHDDGGGGTMHSNSWHYL